MRRVIDPQTLRALRPAHDGDQQTVARTAPVDPSVVSRLERELHSDLDASVLVAGAQRRRRRRCAADRADRAHGGQLACR